MLSRYQEVGIYYWTVVARGSIADDRKPFFFLETPGYNFLCFPFSGWVFFLKKKRRKKKGKKGKEKKIRRKNPK